MLRIIENIKIEKFSREIVGNMVRLLTRLHAKFKNWRALGTSKIEKLIHFWQAGKWALST